MRSAVRFSSIVGRATLIVTVGSIGLILALSKFGFDPDKKSKAALPVLILTVLSPTCAAAVWMFRKLRKIYSAREALCRSLGRARFLYPNRGLWRSILTRSVSQSARMRAGPAHH
jgi:hypothetical protein